MPLFRFIRISFTNLAHDGFSAGLVTAVLAVCALLLSLALSLRAPAPAGQPVATRGPLPTESATQPSQSVQALQFAPFDTNEVSGTLLIFFCFAAPAGMAAMRTLSRGEYLALLRSIGFSKPACMVMVSVENALLGLLAFAFSVFLVGGMVRLRVGDGLRALQLVALFAYCVFLPVAASMPALMSVLARVSAGGKR
jgi:hypothetical protein